MVVRFVPGVSVPADEAAIGSLPEFEEWDATEMTTNKNSFMTQIASAVDKAALGAAAATRLVCDPAKVGGCAPAARKENAWPMMNLLLFPEFCCEPTGAWKEAEEVLVNLDRYA